MSSATPLGDRLRAARTAAGQTQAEAADFLSVRTMTLSAWENGKHEPRAGQLRRLAKLYQVDAGWLLTGEGQGPAEAA